MVSFGKQISRGFNSTFSKRNVSNVLGKAGDVALRAAPIAGDIVGGVGAITTGAGYASGNPALMGAGKGLMIGGAALKGTGSVARGIQKAKRY